MPITDYVTLGRSGLRVSPMCLGAMTFGEDLGWGASVEESQRIIDRYLERGGNFIDTANMYTRGHSEKIIGDHLGRHPRRRDRVVIATKFFGSLYAGDPNGGGTGRKSMMEACEQSLRRLQTDYIDLYWMHCWDRFTPIEETLRGLDDLLSAGKIRYVGFSDTPAWKTAQAQTLALWRGYAPISALQIEYSLLERTVEGELVPMAQELGMGVTPWSPLRYGVLTGKYTRQNAGQIKPDRGEWVTGALDERAYTVVDALIALAREIGSTPARVALAWLASRPGVTSIIIGARSVSQLEDNLAASELTLGADQLARLDQISRPTLSFPADFVRRAGMFSQGGTSINGEAAPLIPLVPRNDDERW